MLISISGATSRAGKTALAETVLTAAGPGRARAVKFTTTEDVFERCPRGTPCLVCDIDVPFRLVTDRETLDQPGTDTARLRLAGARDVTWAIAKRAAVGAAWRAVLARLAAEGPAASIVIEGSTIVDEARPDLLFFVVHPFLSPERWKPGAASLMARADVLVVNRPSRELRAPAEEVMLAVRAARGERPIVVADVASPLEAWAPELAPRMRE